MLLQQDNNVAVITHDESAAVFFRKNESLKEYWKCILNALIYLEDDGKGHRPELIFGYGGDMTLLIHERNKAMNFYSIVVLSSTPYPRTMLSLRFSKPSSSTNYMVERQISGNSFQYVYGGF